VVTFFAQRQSEDPDVRRNQRVLSKTIKTFDAAKLAEWRAWLAGHHASESEIWLVFHKRDTGRDCITYEDAIDEALCFGWVDSLVTRLDDKRYARKFTPRKTDSKWSTMNRNRYAQLKAGGRLMPTGLDRPPTHRSGDAPRPSLLKVPPYIQETLSKHPAAQRFFQALAPSYRRTYIGWIDSAKQQATKMRRLDEAVRLLVAGKKLGLK
jgi:uncharacterized protein YdeI (YjbR/CyaY-like superfamily)